MHAHRIWSSGFDLAVQLHVSRAELQKIALHEVAGQVNDQRREDFSQTNDSEPT